MKIGHIEIPSTDPTKTSELYCGTLGFNLETEQGGKFYWLTRDEITFLIRPVVEDDMGHNLVFYSSEAENEADKIRNGGLDVKFGSDNCFHFKDMNNHNFQIVDPGEDHSG